MYKLYTALLITLAVIVPVRYVSADDKPTLGSYEAVLLQRLAAATCPALLGGLQPACLRTISS